MKDATTALMVENRPVADFVAHAILILGVIVVAFPLWVTFVASTRTFDEIVNVPMALTPGSHLVENYRQALTGGPGPGLVDDIRINWVWMPPWGPDKITDDGREQLRALGFRV